MLSLCSETELETELARRALAPDATAELPLVGSPLGPGSRWKDIPGTAAFYRVPSALISATQRIVLVGLVPDASMRASLGLADVAALELASPDQRICPDGIYAVHRKHDTVLRRIRRGSRYIYLITDDNADRPELWEAVPGPAFDPLPSVQGRVCWLGRKDGTECPGGYFLDRATSE